MKATEFRTQLSHSLEELLVLTASDDTGSELEQQLSANGDVRCVQHGAYGIVENCKKIFDQLLRFEVGEAQPTEWQRRNLIFHWELALDIYWHKVSVIDEYYQTEAQ